MNGLPEPGVAAFATMQEGMEASLAACKNGALARAEAIWDKLHARFDRPAVFWHRQATMLQRAKLTGAADALLRAAAQWFDDRGIFLELATGASERGDWPEAARRWAQVRALSPNNARACFAEVRALRRCGRFAEADVLAAAGERQFADAPEVLIERGSLAEDQRDWPAALLIWEELRQRFPGNAQGHVRGVSLLFERGRLAEADALAAEAIERFPKHHRLAILRWRIHRKRRPDNPEGYVREAELLIRSGRWKAAETLISGARERFENNADLLLQWAVVAGGQKDTPEAIRRAEEVRRRFPKFGRGYIESLIILREARRLDEAEAVATEALRLFPENAWVWIQSARVAEGREDWPAMISRWQHVRSRWPNNLQGLYGAGRAMARVEWQQAAGSGQAGAPAGAMLAEEEPDAAALRVLFMQFEGLGDNCEFGQVQRRYAAEPLGLLRWGGIPAVALIEALDNDFVHFSDPDNIVLTCEPGKEYYLRVPKAQFQMHTFTEEGEIPYEKLLQQTTRRLLFLREKLLSDLQEGEKIFVHKPANGILPERLIGPLFTALRRHGKGTLLCVRLADAGHPPGSVELRQPGLMVGYLDRVSPSALVAEISHECWLTLCRAAAQLHASMTAAAPVSAPGARHA